MRTSLNEFMTGIHERIAMIVRRGQWAKWLDPESHDADAINAMLKPCPADLLECVEVSTLVNSPRNNRAEVLEPVTR
jgi:putative SOS response-associated peptidase YedK